MPLEYLYNSLESLLHDEKDKLHKEAKNLAKAKIDNKLQVLEKKTTTKTIDTILDQEKEKNAKNAFNKALERLGKNRKLSATINTKSITRELVAGQIIKESFLDNNKTSKSGADGYWQVQPGAKKDVEKFLSKFGITKIYDLDDPVDSMIVGIIYRHIMENHIGAFIDQKGLDISDKDRRRIILVAYNLGENITKGILSQPGVNTREEFVGKLCQYGGIQPTKDNRTRSSTYGIEYQNRFGSQDYSKDNKSILVPTRDRKTKKVTKTSIPKSKIQESINYGEIISSINRHIKNRKIEKIKDLPKPPQETIEQEDFPQVSKEHNKMQGKFNFNTWINGIKVESHKLQGKVFVLDPGHSGNDPGAVPALIINGVKKRIHESALAYDIALRIAANLRRQGATVYFTHYNKRYGITNAYNPQKNTKDNYEHIWSDTGRTVYNPNSLETQQKQSLKRRKEVVQSIEKKIGANKDITFMSIHLDSAGKKDLPISIKYNASDPASKKFAQQMILSRKGALSYKDYKRGKVQAADAKEQGLFVLNNSHIKNKADREVLVEVANIQSPEGAQKVITANGRQSMANAISAATVRTLGNGS